MPRAATPRSRRTNTSTAPIMRKFKSKPEVVITRPPAAAPSSASASASPPVPPRMMKVEPTEPGMPSPSSRVTITIRPRPPPAPPVLPHPSEPWKHPDELEFIEPSDLSEDALIAQLCAHAFSVPPRPGHSTDPWVKIIGKEGVTTILPRGYRLPLMFAMKFQWESLRLVMTSPDRDGEWDGYKFDILHVSRLCTRFLREAREQMQRAGMDRMWRCPMFDRALARYYRRWLVSRVEFLRDFWIEFEEEEYERDVLKNDWMRFVLKGHKGFRLTKEEVISGLSFDTITQGLGYHNGRINWIPPPRPTEKPEKQEKKVDWDEWKRERYRRREEKKKESRRLKAELKVAKAKEKEEKEREEREEERHKDKPNSSTSSNSNSNAHDAPKEPQKHTDPAPAPNDAQQPDKPKSSADEAAKEKAKAKEKEQEKEKKRLANAARLHRLSFPGKRPTTRSLRADVPGLYDHVIREREESLREQSLLELERSRSTSSSVFDFSGSNPKDNLDNGPAKTPLSRTPSMSMGMGMVKTESMGCRGGRGGWCGWGWGCGDARCRSGARLGPIAS
ncbi:hypothetical protein FPV67DRAFT_301031 [Lyophyllum atratum]|nr:hypothetical protein FPV67DRAFT_301031 [Lyophyllum atratum]